MNRLLHIPTGVGQSFLVCCQHILNEGRLDKPAAVVKNASQNFALPTITWHLTSIAKKFYPYQFFIA
jgi:hypothetical protein